MAQGGKKTPAPVVGLKPLPSTSVDKETEARFRIIDGLAQKARDNKLTSPDVNLALSMLLEIELAFLTARLAGDNKDGVVLSPQQNSIVTERVRAVTPIVSPGVKSTKVKKDPRKS